MRRPFYEEVEGILLAHGVEEKVALAASVAIGMALNDRINPPSSFAAIAAARQRIAERRAARENTPRYEDE